MGLLDKVKSLLRGNKKGVSGAVDKVADAIQSKTPDSVDAKVEAASDKVKGLVDKVDGD